MGILDDIDTAAELAGPDSWEPVDLGRYLRGDVKRPEPSVGIVRSDGLHLLYPGREHAVIGEMESGKTWFAAACVAAELVWQRPVVYLHFEEADPLDLIERLRALGVQDSDMIKLLRFVAPYRQGDADALARLLDPAPSLVVFDGVNEAMSLHRWAIREEDGAALFRRYLVMPCLRVGASTLACDHVVKDAERRGRYALGSIHKGNGLSGALILLENADPFGRGRRGASHVFVTKDRPGHLRQHGRRTKVPGKSYMGTLVVDDRQIFTPDLELKFWAPKEPDEAEAAAAGDDTDTVVLAAVQRIIDAGKEANLRTIRATVPLRAAIVDDALARLVFTDTLIETCGKRGARLFATVSGDHLPDGGP